MHDVARQLIKWAGQVHGAIAHTVGRVVRRIHLWGAWEIQQALGVGRTRARELMHRKGFPDPADDTLRRGSVWFQTEVEEWIAANRKKLDEPTEGQDT